VGEINSRRLYAGLTLDYRLRLLAPTSASRAVSAVADLFVTFALEFAELCSCNHWLSFFGFVIQCVSKNTPDIFSCNL